jgi:hypothetical protein
MKRNENVKCEMKEKKAKYIEARNEKWPLQWKSLKACLRNDSENADSLKNVIILVEKKSAEAHHLTVLGLSVACLKAEAESWSLRETLCYEEADI